MGPARVIATFATALLLVAGLGYALSQTMLARQPVAAIPQPQYVEAPPDRKSVV